MRFEFATATQIVFGAGSARAAAPAAREMGSRVLLVTGSDRERHSFLADQIESGGLTVARFSVGAEPTVGLVQEGITLARKAACDLVIGLGGGSALDVGKAVAALLTNEGDLIDYLELIGGGRRLTRPAAPFIAIPTTAGTGSEVTRNAVLAAPERGIKVSMRSPLMLPRLAIVDPDLTLGLPPPITASTGLDAITQLIEPYVSSRANPITDALCLEGLTLAARSLPRAFADGQDANARSDMSLASLLGGLALANAGLGVVHGCAAPIGGMFHAPHGAVCAVLLGPGMAANVRALRQRDPGSRYLSRYRKIASLLTGIPGSAPEEASEFARRLCTDLAVPTLGAYGVQPGDVPLLAERASQASSMRGNPILLTQQELTAMLLEAL